MYPRSNSNLAACSISITPRSDKSTSTQPVKSFLWFHSLSPDEGKSMLYISCRRKRRMAKMRIFTVSNEDQSTRRRGIMKTTEHFLTPSKRGGLSWKVVPITIIFSSNFLIIFLVHCSPALIMDCGVKMPNCKIITDLLSFVGWWEHSPLTKKSMIDIKFPCQHWWQT